jgi:hypothetical protein
MTGSWRVAGTIALAGAMMTAALLPSRPKAPAIAKPAEEAAFDSFRWSRRMSTAAAPFADLQPITR